MSAFKALDENHPGLELPDVESEHSAGYIVGLLHEAGLMSSTGMGPVPLSWVDIEAWLNATGTKLETWEKLMIKTMSEAYVGERLDTEPNKLAPWIKVMTEEELAEQRAEISNNLLNFLRGFKRKPGTKGSK